MLLIIIIRLNGALEAEFPGLDFIQCVHHLVLQVFNLVLNIGDLGSKLVGKDH
jgi:hypothetical protein